MKTWTHQSATVQHNNNSTMSHVVVYITLGITFQNDNKNEKNTQLLSLLQHSTQEIVISTSKITIHNKDTYLR